MSSRRCCSLFTRIRRRHGNLSRSSSRRTARRSTSNRCSGKALESVSPRKRRRRYLTKLEARSWKLEAGSWELSLPVRSQLPTNLFDEHFGIEEIVGEEDDREVGGGGTA